MWAPEIVDAVDGWLHFSALVAQHVYNGDLYSGEKPLGFGIIFGGEDVHSEHRMRLFSIARLVNRPR
ncbi:MAG: hypothetical protein IPL86_11930 [Flavobacteriales bacterium]|nr:hypothetical protein [Flavobacteriales bacterium]